MFQLNIYLCCEDTSHLTPLQTQLRWRSTKPQPGTSAPNTEGRWCKLSLVWTAWHFPEESCTPRRPCDGVVPARRVGCLPSWPWLWGLLPARLTSAGIACVILQWTPTSSLERAEDWAVPQSAAAGAGCAVECCTGLMTLSSRTDQSSNS